MIGIGTDLCAVSRMEKAIQKESFLRRFFTQQERETLQSRGKGMAQSAAAMFAAKEAVVKALGTGFSGGIMPEQVEVLHSETGAPSLSLHGAAREKMEALGGQRMLVSLSHEGDFALAFVILE